MAVKKGNAQAVYNSGGVTLNNGDETGLFVNSTGQLLVAGAGGTGTGASQELGAYQTVTLQNAAVATGNGTAIDLSGMGGLGIVVTGTFVGTVTFEIQDAVGNWNTALVQTNSTTSLVSTATATGVFHRPSSGFSAFRARISAYTSGSITVTAFAENTAYIPIIQNMGMYERLDATNDAITNYPLGHSFLNIAAGTATTTVKTGAGVLEAIVFNGPATATNTTTVYDNTAASGTVIAIPLATAIVAPTTVRYGNAFTIGLTIITATANGANMTVVYR